MQLLMRRPELNGFISVSPPANMYDFAFLAPCPSSGLIVHGRTDQVVPEADIQKLADKLAAQKGITVNHTTVDGANHFYDNKLDELAVAVDAYLDKRFGADKK
jgi:alpha/beta superfamily hydrolase